MVRVRVVEAEGQADEVAQAIAQFLQNAGNGAGGHVAIAGDGNVVAAEAGFPPEVGNFLAEETIKGPRRALLSELLGKVLEWDDVKAVRGTSRTSQSGYMNYLRLHRQGSPLGAFAYVHGRRSSVSLRLPKTRAAGTKYARGRDVVATNPHQLIAPVPFPEQLEEALTLIREAYEAALGK